MTLSGEIYPIMATVDALLWTFNYTCRRDSSLGHFCAPVYDLWANGNASDLGCSDCVLGTSQLQLGNELGYNDELAGNFSSLVSSCHATNYPITSPPSNRLNRTAIATATTTSASPEKSCYSTYTIKPDDDCHKISNSQKVSTNNLLYLNNLQGGCANFPRPGQTLCMPRACNVYTVRARDTCRKITGGGGFTPSQLIAWNIDINKGCDNFDQLVGMQICISPPGDEGALARATSTQRTQPINPCVGGTTTGPPSCYATTYRTVPMWTFPKASRLGPNTMRPPNTTSHVLAPTTNYPVRPTGAVTVSSANTTSYALPPMTTYPVRSSGTMTQIPQFLYWMWLSIFWIQLKRINR
jgi:LysM repeat protein